MSHGKFLSSIFVLMLCVYSRPGAAAIYNVDFANGTIPDFNGALELDAPGGIRHDGELGEGGSNYYAYAALAFYSASFTEGFSIGSFQVSSTQPSDFSNILRVQTIYSDGRPVLYQEFEISGEVGFTTIALNETNVISASFASMTNPLGIDNIEVRTGPVSVVPLPSAMFLFFSGLGTLVASRRDKRRRVS